MGDIQAITFKLDRASELMFARNIAVVDEFWSEGFRLIGSEEGEIVATRDDLVALMNRLFAAPFRVRWNWDDTSFTIENDIAWVFAQGHLELVRDSHTDRPSYRLMAIFRRDGDDWKWRLFSGSEPVPARPLP